MSFEELARLIARADEVTVTLDEKTRQAVFRLVQDAYLAGQGPEPASLRPAPNERDTEQARDYWINQDREKRIRLIPPG